MNKAIVLLSFFVMCAGCAKRSLDPFQFAPSGTNLGITQNNKVILNTTSRINAKIDIYVIPADNGVAPMLSTLQVSNLDAVNFTNGLESFTYKIDSIISGSAVNTANYNNVLLIDQSTAAVASADSGPAASWLTADIFSSNYRISGIQYYMMNANTTGNILVYGASNNGIGAGALNYVTSKNSGSQNYTDAISNLSFQMNGSNSILPALNALVCDSMQANSVPQNITVFTYSVSDTSQPNLVKSISTTALQKGIKINFIYFASEFQNANDYLEVANLTGGFFSYTDSGQNYILVCKNIDALLHQSLPVNEVFYHIDCNQLVFDDNFWIREFWGFAVQTDIQQNNIPVFTKIYQ